MSILVLPSFLGMSTLRGGKRLINACLPTIWPARSLKPSRNWIWPAGTVLQTSYRCAAEDCRKCPRREACTPSPEKGRSVSRLEHEDLVDELRARRETPAAKELYKLRRQTIELRYADLKQPRQLRRFNHYGPRRARAQIAAAVLAYKLLILQKNL